LGSVSSLVSEKKIFEISANQSILLALAAILNPLGRLEPNLAGMFLGWSSTNLLFFVPVGYSIWLPGPIICKLIID
jgi:hypothetical protein